MDSEITNMLLNNITPKEFLVCFVVAGLTVLARFGWNLRDAIKNDPATSNKFNLKDFAQGGFRILSALFLLGAIIAQFPVLASHVMKFDVVYNSPTRLPDGVHAAAIPKMTVGLAVLVGLGFDELCKRFFKGTFNEYRSNFATMRKAGKFISMASKKMKTVLIIFLPVLLLSGCVTERRVVRYLEKHDFPTESRISTTVTFRDSLAYYPLPGRISVIRISSESLNGPNPVVTETETGTVIVNPTDDGIDIQIEEKRDTIRIPIKIPEQHTIDSTIHVVHQYHEVPPKSHKTFKILALTGWGLHLITLGLIIFRITNKKLPK